MLYHILNGLYLAETGALPKPAELEMAQVQQMLRLEGLDLSDPPTPDQLKSGSSKLHEALKLEKRLVLYSNQQTGHTVTLVLAYLMDYEGMDLPNAYTLVSHNFFLIKLPLEWLRALVEAYQLPYRENELAYHQFAPRLVAKVADSLSPITTSGLYLGSITAMQRQKRVQEAGIQAVLRLDNDQRGQVQWSAETFKVLDMPLMDGVEFLPENFQQATAFIHEHIQAGHKTLVHCQMGVSRSVTMVLAYMIEHEKMSLPQAYAAVVKRRAIAHPHPQLFRSLVKQYQLPYGEDEVMSLGFRDRLLIEASHGK